MLILVSALEKLLKDEEFQRELYEANLVVAFYKKLGRGSTIKEKTTDSLQNVVSPLKYLIHIVNEFKKLAKDSGPPDYISVIFEGRYSHYALDAEKGTYQKHPGISFTEAVRRNWPSGRF